MSKVSATDLKNYIEKRNSEFVMNIEDYERFVEAYPDLRNNAEAEKYLIQVLQNQGFEV